MNSMHGSNASDVSVNILIIQSVAFLAAIWIFSASLQHPHTLQVSPYVSLSSEPPDPVFASTNVLDQVSDMEPSRMYADGKIDEALVEAKKLLKSSPTDFQTQLCVGNIFCAAGDQEKGFKLLKETTKLAPNNQPVRLNYVQHLVVARRFDTAISEYQDLIERFPADKFESHYQLSKLYMSSAQPQKAVEEQTTLLKIEPDNLLVRQDMAFCLAASGHQDEGFEQFATTANALKDTKWYAADARATLESTGDVPDKAIEDLRAEAASKPNDLQSQLKLVGLLLYLGQNDRAKELAEKVTQKAPSNFEGLALLSESQMKLGATDDARQSFIRAAECLVKHDESMNKRLANVS